MANGTTERISEYQRQQNNSTFKRFQTRWETLRDTYRSTPEKIGASALLEAAEAVEKWAHKVERFDSLERYAIALTEVIIKVGSYQDVRIIARSLDNFMDGLGRATAEHARLLAVAARGEVLAAHYRAMAEQYESAARRLEEGNARFAIEFVQSAEAIAREGLR